LIPNQDNNRLSSVESKKVELKSGVLKTLFSAADSHGLASGASKPNLYLSSKSNALAFAELGKFSNTFASESWLPSC
jgi:hypothetical protein